MIDSKPIIDMEPKSKEEIEIYNQFVQIAFNNRFKNGNDFTCLYNGFAASFEKKRLNEILLRADDFMILLEYIKKEIEKAFNYPASLQKEKEQHDRITDRYNQFSRLRLDNPSLLFAQMCLGIEYNSDKHVLDEHALLHYTHTREVYEYYKYVKRLLEKGIESIKAESSDSNEDEEQKSSTKENIISILETLSNGSGWQYAFNSRKDYETFLDLLTAFFDSKKYKIPKNAIILKKGTKTEVAKKLKVIYQQSGIKKTLKNNTDYFCLIKHLDSFKDVTDDQLYSALMK